MGETVGPTAGARDVVLDTVLDDKESPVGGADRPQAADAPVTTTTPTAMQHLIVDISDETSRRTQPTTDNNARQTSP